MTFRLSQRSLDNLRGVHPGLTGVVEKAIRITEVDFGVTQGVRTFEEQKANVQAGRSRTMASKHLLQDDGFCHAVDVVAYVGSNISWELNLYDDICDAMATAAKELEVPIKWGAAWSEGDIRFYSEESGAEGAMLSYIDLRRSQGRRPFIDAPHFELIT